MQAYFFWECKKKIRDPLQREMGKGGGGGGGGRLSLGGSFELDFPSFLSSFFSGRGALGRAEGGKQARSNNLIHSHRKKVIFRK